MSRKAGFHAVLALVLTSGVAFATDTKSFCEFGSAIAASIGAGGAVWNQTWGERPKDWFECSASPNVGFLGGNVVGLQNTKTSGRPVITTDLILSLPFQGEILLIAPNEKEPEKVSGTILGAMRGNFVADLNAARALIDDDTITIRFGSPLHSGPDALIEVLEATGEFKSLHAVGEWEWHVNGTLTIARVPGLAPQVNILAALANSALILGAEEEVVLSGSYFRATPVLRALAFRGGVDALLAPDETK